jgi:hypothetical protein
MKQKYQNFLMLLLMISFLLLATATAAENSTSGKVRFTSTAVSLGVGAEWGEGTLTLNDGSQHPFKMKGIKVIGVGYKKVSAVGTVYNLTISMAVMWRLRPESRWVEASLESP